MDNNSEPQAPKQKPEKGYGKRPVWQWIVLYLIVGVVVYGFVYYFFMYSGSGRSGY